MWALLGMHKNIILKHSTWFVCVYAYICAQDHVNVMQSSISHFG